MRVIKLVMIEAGPLSEGVIRPYETDLKHSVIEKARLLTNDGEHVNARRLAGVSTNLLSTTIDNKHESHIDGGWRNNRFIFSMLVEIEQARGVSSYEYIVGYTDRAEYSDLRGRVRFDEDMRMYFNSITRVKMSEQIWDKSKSTVWTPRVEAYDQILLRKSLLGSNRLSQTNLTPSLMRPVDMLRRREVDLGFSDFTNLVSDNVSNTTARFNRPLVANNRLNNTPTHYLARTTNAYIKAASDPTKGLTEQGAHDTALSETIEAVRDNVLECDPYLSRLRRTTNILEQGYITYGELLQLNPGLEDSKDFGVKPLKYRRHGDHVRWQGDSLTSDTPASLAAYMISQTLPAIMINSMISRIKCVIRSHVREGEDTTLIADAYPFVSGMKIQSSIPYFETQISDILIPDVSKDGAIEFEAHITADIDGMIEIDISLFGGEEEFFSFPVFADGLMSPTLSTSIKHADAVSDDVTNFLAALTDVRLNKYPNHVEDKSRSSLFGASLSTNDSSRRSNKDW